jgi:carbon monoxide dehydrogenase subunit G
MPAVSCETRVAAPPAKVFGVFSDIEHAADRISGIKRVEKLTPGPVGVGTRFKETRVMFGKEATEEMTFTAFEPGRQYTLGAESCGCRYVTDFRFEPDGAGTRVIASFTAQPQSIMAKVMGVLMGWMMKRMLTKCLRKDMDELKAAAEGG